MDFAAMLKPVRFGPPKGDDVPRPHLRGPAAARRFAALREAREILDTLPGPGESLHCIQSGRFDLADVIQALLERLGTARHLRIATLSFNGRNVHAIKSWIEAGRANRVTLLCSAYFRDADSEIYHAAMAVLRPPHRLAAARNHCKVVCLDFADGSKLALEGSANLRTNSNREQFALIADAALHDWHALWIDEQVAANEGDQSGNPATG